MRLVGLFLASCLASFLLVACSNVAPVTPVALTTANAAQSSTHLIASRNVQIPVTLTVPTDTSSAMPLVVMLHGHGGTRDEAGGFTQIAEELADAGIASVRMDFAGCGESAESFRNNRLSTMLADARAARDYAIDTVDVDTNRMGLMGFSMGGRLAITLANEDPRFHTLSLIRI